MRIWITIIKKRDLNLTSNRIFRTSQLHFSRPQVKMAMRFNDLEPSLSEESLAAINDFGFTHMTPVQASSIPQFLKNKVSVESKTNF